MLKPLKTAHEQRHTIPSNFEPEVPTLDRGNDVVLDAEEFLVAPSAINASNSSSFMFENYLIP